MAFKLVVLSAVLAYANAGFLGGAATYAAAPALAYGAAAPALGSTFHGSYGAPAVAYGAVAAPAIAHAAPVSYATGLGYGAGLGYRAGFAAPALAYGGIGHAVAAPAYGLRAGLAAPALAYGHAAGLGFRAGLPAVGLRSAIAAPALSYGAISHAAVAAPALAYGGIGHAVAAPAVAYSAAPAVSHLSYASGYANYGW